MMLGGLSFFFFSNLMCVCVCAFSSAGLSWEGEAETYESSFYKRSLDNDLYIFTPSPDSKENGESPPTVVGCLHDMHAQIF